MEQYPDIPVQAKDVFFHFIHSLKVIDGDTVRYINDLSCAILCLYNLRKKTIYMYIW